MITVYDFLDLCIEKSFQTVALYDMDSGEIVYKGSAEDVPYEYSEMEVWSWDCLTKGSDVFTINIDCGE